MIVVKSKVTVIVSHAMVSDSYSMDIVYFNAQKATMETPSLKIANHVFRFVHHALGRRFSNVRVVMDSRAIF